jgi:predicted amidohydrolase YtcJ
MQFELTNAYDSHTHFWATGQVAEGLQLHSLTSAEDVARLQIKPQHQRGSWIVGFGWNQNNWPNSEFPHKTTLDKIFKDQPVFFSRVDGHASWVNSAAIAELSKAGYDFSKDPQGGMIQRDSKAEPTGILLDQAHINALLMLPNFSDQQNLNFFETSQKIFNQAGFTHVRDMSMNPYFWNLLRKMEDQKKLTVALDALMTVENLDQLPEALVEIKKMQQDGSEQLKLSGVKIFIDGSLGSKTAYLSENYLNTQQRGLLIWNYEDIRSLIKTSWQAGQQVAIHTIGDAAVETAVRAAREVSAGGVLGRLHLEHVQLLSAQCLQLMKPLHVTCHLQPCHWLSDSSWVKQALPESLIKNLFQWQLLKKNKIPFYFGSDSPIERTSLFDNLKALQQSAEWGVPALMGHWQEHHQYPDANWCASKTVYEDHQVKQVYFKGNALF